MGAARAISAIYATTETAARPDRLAARCLRSKIACAPWIRGAATLRGIVSAYSRRSAAAARSAPRSLRCDASSVDRPAQGRRRDGGGGGQDGTAAAAKHEPESTDEFSQKFFRHFQISGRFMPTIPQLELRPSLIDATLRPSQASFVEICGVDAHAGTGALNVRCRKH